ncbi:MAG: hypothetical protein HY922_13985 [Elusimicrobia bacterium]|nr:hypothetical protein [Elusimicrobiota bacterium]
MIATLRGALVEKSTDRAVLEAGGVGYEVLINPSTSARLPEPCGQAELHISETVGLYGGGTTLYGFISREEKELFLCLKEHVPSTGAKKALEYLEKASRSLPDFRRSVYEGDARVLSAVFGFTKKTAEKLLVGLKDKAGGWELSGSERVIREARPSGALAQAADALASLGYKPSEVAPVIEAIARELPGRGEPGVEEILRMALKRL